MGAYVLKRHNTVAQYITTRPILDLFEKTVRRTGALIARRRWEQEILEILGTCGGGGSSGRGRG